MTNSSKDVAPIYPDLWSESYRRWPVSRLQKVVTYKGASIDRTLSEGTGHFYAERKNWDTMSRILVADEHKIYWYVTLPFAAVAGEVFAKANGNQACYAEIGPGDGATSEAWLAVLKEKQLSPEKIVFVDPFPQALAQTQEKATALWPQIKEKSEFWQSGIEADDLLTKHPDDKGKFDGIVSVFSLNYAENAEQLIQTLKNIKELLKSHGQFLGLFNFYYPEQWQGDEINQSQWGTTFRMKDKTHSPAKISVQLNSVKDPSIKTEEFINFIFSEEEFRRAAQAAGFGPEEITIVDLKKAFGFDQNPEIKGLEPTHRAVILKKS